MKKLDDYASFITLLAVIGVGGGIFFYQTRDKVVEPTAPIVVVEPVVVEASPITAPEAIELPEMVIVGRHDKAPFRSGTVMCQWWEDAGLRAVANLDGWAESTCTGDTCFLLVHDADLPAYAIMAAWLSEASKQGHDPRIDDIELSVFVFKGEKEVDHIAYFPKRDVFESF